MFKKKRIYMDNTATTRTRREVIREMAKYFSRIYANPSSIHEGGLIARGSIEMARERIAFTLGCDSDEIIFTGSGSESNNTAIKGVAEALRNKGRHIITSPIEHSSVIKACRALAREDYEITYIKVDSNGRFDLEDLARVIREDTILVTLGYVNNEIGTVQDVESIVNTVKNKGVHLHFDAVQALPYLKMDLSSCGADLVSFSGHKIYAPKGVGLLYVRRGTEISPLIDGGEQEFGWRSGTENVPYIVGLSKAIQLNDKEKTAYAQGLAKKRDRLIAGVLSGVPGVMLTGDPERRSPNHASFCLSGINGKMLVKALSQQGIEVSSGSACSSPKNNPSHVLKACGVPEEYLYGGLRVTLGRYNSDADVERFLHLLPQVVRTLREEGTPYNNEAIFISGEELRRKLEAGEPVQLIDVRQVKYPRKMIPGSVHVPPWRLNAYLKKLDPGRETVVVCYQGDIISPQVQQTLAQKGFTKARVLKGGLFNYFGFSL